MMRYLILLALLLCLPVRGEAWQVVGVGGGSLTFTPTSTRDFEDATLSAWTVYNPKSTIEINSVSPIAGQYDVAVTITEDTNDEPSIAWTTSFPSNGAIRFKMSIVPGTDFLYGTGSINVVIANLTSSIYSTRQFTISALKTATNAWSIGTVNFSAGDVIDVIVAYETSTESSDYVRVYVDGVLASDQSNLSLTSGIEMVRVGVINEDGWVKSGSSLRLDDVAYGVYQ